MARRAHSRAPLHCLITPPRFNSAILNPILFSAFSAVNRPRDIFPLTKYELMFYYNPKTILWCGFRERPETLGSRDIPSLLPSVSTGDGLALSEAEWSLP